MSPAGPARVLVLGPVDLRLGEASVALGAPMQRALLALLALARGRVVPVTSIIDGLWGDDPPATVVNAVQVYVANLRRALAPTGLDSALVTQAPGYRLIVDPGTLDVDVFEVHRAEGDRRQSHGDLEGAAAAYRSALDQWRGPALADLGAAPFAEGERTRLGEARSGALRGWLRALLAIGEHEAALPHLEASLTDHPLDEGLWVLQATALYQAGRQADSLSALRRARRLLSKELGIDPGPALVEVERAILAQDPALAPASQRGPAPSAVTHLATGASSEATLVLPDGTRRTLRTGRVVLGRHHSCDVVIDHRDVSRQHARVDIGPGDPVLEDLGSTNGTAVNGDPLTPGAGPRALARGDRIEIGPVILRYEAASGTP